MNENEIKKFERHIGVGKTISLKSSDGRTDEFYFEPLGVEFLPKMLRLTAIAQPNVEEKKLLKELNYKLKARQITKNQYDVEIMEVQQSMGLRAIQGDNAELIVDLLYAMVKNSYPDLKENILNKFVYNNIQELQNVLFELNEGIVGTDKNSLDKIAVMRDKVQNDETKNSQEQGQDSSC